MTGQPDSVEANDDCVVVSLQTGEWIKTTLSYQRRASEFCFARKAWMPVRRMAGQDYDAQAPKYFYDILILMIDQKYIKYITICF